MKESRLQEALSLFESVGFDLYTPDHAPSMHRTPSCSPPRDSPTLLKDLPTKSGAVLTRTRRGTNTSTSSGTASVGGSPSRESQPRSGQGDTEDSGGRRSKPQSPMKGEVHILSPDLVCVGLSDELGVDHWGLKIVKLVAFPDLIPLQTSNKTSPMSSYPSVLSPLSELHSPVLMRLGRRRVSTSSTSSSSSSEDDGYFSHSPTQHFSSLPTSASRSYTDLSKSTLSTSLKPPSKHIISTICPITPIHETKPSHVPGALSIITDTHTLGGCQAPSNTEILESRIPFFSFTRTSEGSSLTAEASVLAALFPPYERHMVMCSGELDAADARNNGLYDAPDELEETACNQGGIFKCLQVDLRKFGLGGS